MPIEKDIGRIMDWLEREHGVTPCAWPDCGDLIGSPHSPRIVIAGVGYCMRHAPEWAEMEAQDQGMLSGVIGDLARAKIAHPGLTIPGSLIDAVKAECRRVAR